MSLRARIEEWNQDDGQNPFYNSRYPSEKVNPLDEQVPYNPYQGQLKIDNQNNVVHDNPLQDQRETSEWELIATNKVSRLIKIAQANDGGASIINPLIKSRKDSMLVELLNQNKELDASRFPKDIHNNPLATAIWSLNIRAVQLLLDKFHLSINTPFGNGYTPIMVAVLNYDLSDEEKEETEEPYDPCNKMVEFLLRLGADPDAKDPEGNTAHSIAEEFGRPEAIDDAQHKVNWQKLTPEQQSKELEEQKDKNYQRQLDQRKKQLEEENLVSKENYYQEIQLNPKIEQLNKELDQRLTDNDVIDLWRKIKELPDSSQKQLLLRKLQDKTKVATTFKRLLKKAEIPSDFQLIENTPKEAPAGEDTFEKKIKRYKMRREIQPSNTFTAEPSTGLDPGAYYKSPPGSGAIS